MEFVVLSTTLAEIAGVFVGFAALIGVTRRSEIGGAQLARFRAVVTTGLMVIVAALVPVGQSSTGSATVTCGPRAAPSTSRWTGPS